MIHRRALLIGLLAAPAIVQVENLMKLPRLILPKSSVTFLDALGNIIGRVTPAVGEYETVADFTADSCVEIAKAEIRGCGSIPDCTMIWWRNAGPPVKVTTGDTFKLRIRA